MKYGTGPDVPEKGEVISFRKEYSDSFGFECVGFILDKDRIAIVIYSYNLTIDPEEYVCSFIGMSQDYRWKPKISAEEVTNKNELVSPSLVEVEQVSEVCQNKFGTPCSHDFMEAARKELNS